MDPLHGALGGVWKPHPGLSLLGRGLLDLILPPRAHDGAPTQGPGLSAAAWSKITFLDGPVCDGCGSPFGFESGEEVRCPLCQARPRVFARARAACLYDEHSRDLILKLKHADRTDLADALVRQRDTASQGGKSAVGRRRNVAAAFTVPEPRRHRVIGRRILLVDDVLTTGATAEGCARALLAAGAAQVNLAVVARVSEMRARPI